MEIWSIARTTYKVTDFVSWQRAGTLMLSPSFQRRPVWAKGAKSLLLDSILRGLPVPLVLLREQPSDLKSLEPLREVVDGQQRIRTVLSFVAPSLLADFHPEHDDFIVSRAHNAEVAGLPFDRLPADVRQRILDYQFVVEIFPADTDDRDILQIFARMNATGVRLNAQELRNAAYFGEFKTLSYELAAEQLPRWRSWGIFHEYNLARMEEVELTSELLLLIDRGISAKTAGAIDSAYREYDDEYPAMRVAARRFRAVMDSIESKIGENMPLLTFRRKALFYSVFAAFYDRLLWLVLPAQHARQDVPAFE